MSKLAGLSREQLQDFVSYVERERRQCKYPMHELYDESIKCPACQCAESRNKQTLTAVTYWSLAALAMVSYWRYARCKQG